jgi:Na+/H+ antiporter
VLGAIVSPTDPVAANAIASRLGVPRRLIVIIEGESLVNDASALVIYRVGIVAAIGGAFSMTDAGLRFVGAVTGGIAIGLLVGYIVYRLRRPLNNPRAEIALSLMTAYFAYIPAELVGASAVIAAVTAGIYLGWHAPELMRPETRLQSLAVWEILVFLINAFLFALVGLQLPVVLDGLQGESAGSLLGYAAAICATVIVVRFVWVFPATYLPRLMSRRLRERDPYPPWQYPTLISWIGMRGAVTLAAALAVPQLTDAGDPFPGRNLIIFLAFCVILFTLVVQGLSLPGVIRMLGLESDSDADREESLARIRAAEAAVDRLAELEAEEWVREDTAQRIRGLYSFRASRFTARLDATDDGTIEQRSLAYQRLRHELLNVEREAVVDMRRSGEISDEVMNTVIRDLDLEDVRLDA